MLRDRAEILKLAKEFHQICEKHKIWYVVDCGTLLGAIRDEKMIPWDDDFDVMMTPESFAKLQKLFPERIISTDTKNYPLLIPKFMINKKDFLTSAVFIDIFIAIPSTMKKVRRFRSLRNKIRFATQAVHSTWEPNSFWPKVYKILSWPFHKISKRMTYQEAITILKSDNPTGYFTIDNPIDPLSINWQIEISGKRIKKSFEDFTVFVPVEYEPILQNKYTINYLVPNKQKRSIEHVNTVSIVKVKRK